ncbi:MAG TPA: 30S ribosomal protein S16 [Oceanithermus sp.]|nr:30S ribosomal protein S16 [Oceanithermus sp.]
MVKIRLSRFGARNNPHYRIVVTDSRKRRDGAYIERIGYYDPRKTTPDWYKVDVERARYWLSVGAKPTETVDRLFKLAGVYEPKPVTEEEASS